MSIAVACQCGRRFQAKDHLAGRRAKCPGCGGVLTIPALRRPAESAHRETSVRDDLPVRPAGAPAAARRLGPPRSRDDNSKIVVIASIAGGGALVLLLLLILAVRLLPSGGAAVAVSSVSDGVADAVVKFAPEPARPRPVPVRPSSTAADNSGSAETNDSQADESPGDGSGSSASPSLAAGALQWHAQEAALLRGSFAAKESESDSVYGHFSWMCQLLPYMGRDELHSRFNFDQVWLKNPNLALAVTRIPEFLNPLDDRHHWKGYPFQGVALTHFVGMSGVEDRRNVLAAELPRSDDRAGIFGYHEVARPAQITDGLGQTIMIIGSGELIQSPWVQGGGATVRGAREPYFDEISGFGSRGLDQRGAMVMFADGSARTLSADMDPSVFRAMCTIHGAETVDVSKWGAPLDRLGSESTPEDREGKVKVLEIFVRERP